MPTIIVPIDASQIPAANRGAQSIKVAVQDATGIKSQTLKVTDGKAQATLDFDGKSTASVAVGPANSADADLFRRQTLTATVSAASLAGKPSITLPPFVITTQWWGIWLLWCRQFTIQGQLKGTNGNPVPNAQVKAFNVDYFWWWSSSMQVGPTATTDANGHFTITFEWCCYWLAIWWWALRAWRLDPVLLGKVLPILKLNPGLKFSPPTPETTLSFTQALRPLPVAVTGRATPTPSPIVPAVKLDPTTISALGTQLQKVLPPVPELEKLRLWPWFPWTPWNDCGPNIIFSATQNCGGAQTNVIVDESVFQARLDIPTNYNVTLVANADACTLSTGQGNPQGDCFAFTEVCTIPASQIAIGGTALAGYAYPGSADRPFSEVINLYGLFGNTAQADYYQIQYRPYNAMPTAAWQPVPAGALNTVQLGYFDSTQTFPHNWFYVDFPATPAMASDVGLVNVYEGLAHYEATHPPNNWGNVGSGRTWFYNIDWMASIQTSGFFADGAYEFQVVGFTQGATELQVAHNGNAIPGCGAAGNNDLVVVVDNRVATAISGSVHIDTTEPACSIASIKINTTTVNKCSVVSVSKGQPFEIQFVVTDEPIGTDPNGHLDSYQISVQWGEGQVSYPLGLVNGTTNTLTADAGNFPGPTYAQAKAQGAAAPSWKGGTMTLHIADATSVFPETCAYLITVTAWKRNIVNCRYDENVYYNEDTYSFTVNVV
jgi:hypothetical protein